MKTSQKRKAHPFPRKIHFPDEIWTYRITHNMVQIRNPDLTKTYRVDIYAINHTTEAEWYGDYDRYDHSSIDIGPPSVTPSTVKEYILRLKAKGHGKHDSNRRRGSSAVRH